MDAPERTQPAVPGALWLGVGLLLAGLCMGAVALLVADWRLAPLRTALDQRPPVLVLDLESALSDQSAEDASARLAELLQMARELGEQGVLVLDEKAVLSAPRRLVIVPRPEARGSRP
ncbi:MAG: hypothetical protein EA400_14410 [Chromatiaceae bacterium]|nr:MAG: hypothetical protein EA400_14410 [Chromatiaceae bacterium]